jgi:hypothetical protein
VKGIADVVCLTWNQVLRNLRRVRVAASFITNEKIQSNQRIEEVDGAAGMKSETRCERCGAVIIWR